MGRNVSRSEEKVALRYVRGEDLGIYGSGGRGSSDTGNTGSRAWVWASGTGQSSGDRAGLGALPCGHGTGSRAMGVLAYFLAKGTCTERRGVQHQDLRGGDSRQGVQQHQRDTLRWGPAEAAGSGSLPACLSVSPRKEG